MINTPFNYTGSKFMLLEQLIPNFDYSKKYFVDGFLELRKNFNDKKSPEKLWALMLSCTNNMMRFNKKFEFNQTFGKRSWNDSTEKKVNNFVKHISDYKEKVFFTSKDFTEIKPQNPSMIYIDPPYTNTEAGYNSYWSKTKERQLYDYIIEINKLGHSFALSGMFGEHKNGEKSDIIYKLLEDGFNHKILEFDYEKVARKKNSKNSQEIMIYNYNGIEG